MARVRGRDTGPERTVRSVRFSLRYRFRLHGADLPGRPDIVLRSRRCVIFVHGCSWHRHECRNGRRMPKSRAAFWRAKLEGNAERDKRTRARLRRLGWRVPVVWERQLRDVDKLAARLRAFLDPAQAQ
jgi:DNA mismatch endonuclease (patch repair protein)